MSKAVLISIQPNWCELIASGEKTLEVRKTRPKLETPFKCYIYCTKSNDTLWVLNTISRMEYGISTVCANLKDAEGACPGNGKVIGEFVCDRIQCFDVPYPAFQKELDKRILDESCCTYYQLHRYAYHDALYGWHISDLVVYDEPKELSEFYAWKRCNSCHKSGYESSACIYDEDCKVPAIVTRPPQSWCYVDELKGGEGL